MRVTFRRLYIQAPFQIMLRNIEATEVIENRIRKKSDKLNQCFD